MIGSKKELWEQVTENKVDIEILQERTKRQEGINESAADAFEKSTIVFDELDREIRLLKKLAAGLVFAAGGLFVMALKTKTELREIRKAMIEG